MIRIGNRILANFVLYLCLLCFGFLFDMASLSREKRKIQSRMIVEKYKILKEIEKGKSCAAVSRRHSQWRRQGGKGARGAVAPNVEKDGPRNSSKFDEKIGGGGGYPFQM